MVLRRSLSSAAASGSGSGSAAPVQKVLDDEDLRAALNAAGSKLVVVDWYAEWCAPCRRIAPLVEQLAEQTPSAVFLKADIDTLEDASVEAGVQSVPTFHFIKDGQLVAEFSGADMNKLKELVAQYK
jgi:thioredoxin 1